MSSANAFEMYGKYKDLYLFNTGKGSVLFKPLTYADCQTAKRITKAYPALGPVVEDNIWEECVIEHTLPGTLETLNAGIVSTIVRLILHFSNPSSLEEIQRQVDLLRDEAQDIRDEIVTKICKAFPAYKPEEIENMEWTQQLKRLIQAEEILGTKFEFTTNKNNLPQNRKDPKNQVITKTGSDGMEYIDFDAENAIMRGQ